MAEIKPPIPDGLEADLDLKPESSVEIYFRAEDGGLKIAYASRFKDEVNGRNLYPHMISIELYPVMVIKHINPDGKVDKIERVFLSSAEMIKVLGAPEGGGPYEPKACWVRGGGQQNLRRLS